jgi:hypothetical protein
MLEVRAGLNIMIFETFSGWKCKNVYFSHLAAESL